MSSWYRSLVNNNRHRGSYRKGKVMLYVLILVVLIAAIWSILSTTASSSRANKLQQKLIQDEKRQKAKEVTASKEQQRSEIEEEWKILARYDKDVRTHVERLEPYGDAALAELKQVYKSIRDKTQVKDIVDQIIEDIENGKFEAPVQDLLDSETQRIDSRGLIADRRGLTEDGKCQVFDTYQVRHRDDGKWWIETLDGECHPSFERGYPNLGQAKRAAVEMLG